MANFGGAVLGGSGGFGGSLSFPQFGPGAISTGGGYGFGAGQGGSAPGIIPGMMDVYNQTLGLNENNYQNMLNTYSTGQNLLASSLPSVYSQYGNTLAGIKQTLGIGTGGFGVAQPFEEQILRTAKQQNSADIGREISSGLYNETGSLGVENQDASYAQQATAQLGAQFGLGFAGYQAQEGNAQAAAMMQGLGMQSQLYGQEGASQAGYRFANTAGNLTGQYSVNPAYGGGGGGGGVRGGLGGGVGGYGAGGGGFNDVASSYYNPTDPWQMGSSSSETAGGTGWGAYVGQGSPGAGYGGSVGGYTSGPPSGYGDAESG